MRQENVVFIVGPTGVGKTDVSVLLARTMGGAIVNADAMQVYREVSIASNRPAPETLKEVPHHLVGFMPVTESFDVAAYNDLALQAVREILGKGKVPVVVGGSGMYVKVLLDGIFEDDGKDERVRGRLEDEARRDGPGKIYERLKIVDPDAAAAIHPHDARRIVRALEVYETRRQPISRLRQGHTGLWQRTRVRLFCLNRERTELYERIHRRTERMFTQGLVDEVRRLDGMALSRSAAGIIGIEEVRGHLRGEYDLRHAADLINLHTRRYAKRQGTWFRKEQRAEWIMIHPHEAAADVTQRILEMTAEDRDGLTKKGQPKDAG